MRRVYQVPAGTLQLPLPPLAAVKQEMKDQRPPKWPVRERYLPRMIVTRK